MLLVETSLLHIWGGSASFLCHLFFSSLKWVLRTGFGMVGFVNSTDEVKVAPEISV